MSSERLAPWRPKPTQEVRELIESLPDVRMYIVARPGPTSFLIKEEGSEVKFKVVIGHCPNCTCMPIQKPGHPCTELCGHIIFVLVKVLRLPVTNPLVWQRSLLDRELDEVLRCSELSRLSNRRGRNAEISHPPGSKVPSTSAAAQKLEPGEVACKPLDPEEPCPICYEDMTTLGEDAKLLLVHCRWGCGRSVHGRCMRIWMEHQTASQERDLTCPLCRTGWGAFTWTPPRFVEKKKEAARPPRDSATHYGTLCGACKKGPIKGRLYLCLVCEAYDLCSHCFEHGAHPAHPFAVQAEPNATPVDVPRLFPPASSSSILPPPPANQEETDDPSTSPRLPSEETETDPDRLPSTSAPSGLAQPPRKPPARNRSATAKNAELHFPPIGPPPALQFGVTGSKFGTTTGGAVEGIQGQPAATDPALALRKRLGLRSTSAALLRDRAGLDIVEGPRGLGLTGKGLSGPSNPEGSGVGAPPPALHSRHATSGAPPHPPSHAPGRLQGIAAGPLGMVPLDDLSSLAVGAGTAHASMRPPPGGRGTLNPKAGGTMGRSGSLSRGSSGSQAQPSTASVAPPGLGLALDGLGLGQRVDSSSSTGNGNVASPHVVDRRGSGSSFFARPTAMRDPSSSTRGQSDLSGLRIG